MTPRQKGGLVAAGYLAAFLVASAAVAVRLATTTGPDAQAASGMYAFGDALLFVAVFGGLALVPTGAALFFVRRHRPFWTGLAVVGLGVGGTGLAAAILFAVGRHVPPPSSLATWGALSVLRILVAPLLTLTFLVCAAMSPYRTPRVALVGAVAMEAAVSAYGGLVWFVPLLVPGR